MLLASARRLETIISRLETKHTCVLVFLVALGVRLAYVFGLKTYLTIEAGELVQVARDFAESNTFANPYKIPTGPTAHVAPVYPFLLGLIYKAFGYGVSGQLAQEILCSVTSSLQYALLPALAAACGFRPAAGALTGMAGAVVPLRLWIETKGSWEPAYAALALLGAILWTVRSFSGAGRRLAGTAGRGLLWGLALLTSPSLLPVFAALLVLEWKAARKHPIKERARHAAVLCCCSAVILLPWTIRNYLQLGGLVFVRSNLGLEVAIANHPRAGVTVDENVARGGDLRHPFVNLSESEELRRLGEIEYNRQRFREAISFVRSDPGRFARLTAARIVQFWFPPSNHPLKRLALAAITVIGALGWWRLYQARPAIACIFAAVWISYPAVYYVTAASPRYSYVIGWSLLVLAPGVFWPPARRVIG